MQPVYPRNGFSWWCIWIAGKTEHDISVLVRKGVYWTEAVGRPDRPPSKRRAFRTISTPRCSITPQPEKVAAFFDAVMGGVETASPSSPRLRPTNAP